MKMVLLLVLCLFFSSTAVSQWNQVQNIPTDTSLIAIDFSDTLHGWIAGVDGEILRTGDGGVTWQLLQTGTGLHFTGICFIDEFNGWAVGYLGDECRIIYTPDGGDNWNVQFTGDYSPGEVFFLDTLNGWVAAMDNTLLHTTNGGATWNAIPMPGLAQPWSVQFLTPDVGYVGGTHYEWGLHAKVFKTIDGGQSWQQIFNIYGDYLFSDMFFLDETHGWMTGWCMIIGIHGNDYYGKYIKYTHNGGNSWGNGLDEPGTASLSVYFTDEEYGWTVTSGGRFLSSTDGGASWSSQTYAPYEGLSDITFSDNMTGWAVGANGTVMQTDNNGALRIINPPETTGNQLKMVPNPAKDLVTLNFNADWSGETHLNIYNCFGGLIKTMSLGEISKGNHSITIMLEGIPEGVFLCRLSTEGQGRILTGKFIRKE